MITLQTITEAQETIRKFIKKTPLVHSRFLSDYCDGEVYLKLENQQVTNSFKIRGAFNRLSQLSPEERKQGVVTASSGNHAQAVALAAEHLQLAATIIVPKNVSKAKLNKIKKYDVNLVLKGDYSEVEPIAIDLARKERLTYISPYNDEGIIAGQGTVGLEIFEELDHVDVITVPIGGGGLISGIAIVANLTNSNVQVVGVQPKASPVMYESLKAGTLVEIVEESSLAEGLIGNLEKDAITFEMIQQHVDKIFVVKEKTIRDAIKLLYTQEQQVTEGSGAISIAPILENKEWFKGKTTVAVISGGNIEKTLFQEIIGE